MTIVVIFIMIVINIRNRQSSGSDLVSVCVVHFMGNQKNCEEALERQSFISKEELLTRMNFSGKRSVEKMGKSVNVNPLLCASSRKWGRKQARKEQQR
jgi:hypothetical protein